MRVGTVREIKDHEYRVGLTPESVRELHAHGHEVWVESGAGRGIGASDRDYEAAGGVIKPAPGEIFAECELIVKVKEPQPAERAQLRRGQVLFTYLHLAPDPDQAADLLASGVTAIAYETVTGSNNSLPLLKPMSQVAGRMSVQAGATALEKEHGGRGVLLGGGDARALQFLVELEYRDLFPIHARQRLAGFLFFRLVAARAQGCRNQDQRGAQHALGSRRGRCLHDGSHVVVVQLVS